MDETSRDMIDRWRRQGLADGEIGRRLGLSGPALREALGEDPRFDPETDQNPINGAQPE